MAVSEITYYDGTYCVFFTISGKHEYDLDVLRGVDSDTCSAPVASCCIMG